MIVISIPTVLDPSLAPDGKHVVHAYTAGNEPYDLFKGLDRNSDKYKELKRERAQVPASQVGGTGERFLFRLERNPQPLIHR